MKENYVGEPHFGIHGKFYANKSKDNHQDQSSYKKNLNEIRLIYHIATNI